MIFDPGFSLLGRLVYGPFHPEPLGFDQPLTWMAPEGWSSSEIDYYASQGNAHRIFVKDELHDPLPGWQTIAVNRYADLAYVASGGYSGPQLYPDFLYPLIRGLERVLRVFPGLFTTRMLVVLEKE